jgi:hypothetical protein
MTHFYLTLPSNSSLDFFPNNTLTEFTTKLADTIELTDEWEVGLAEIMFPRSWYTIPKEGLIMEIDYRRCDIVWQFQQANKRDYERTYRRRWEGENEPIIDSPEEEEYEDTTVRVKINGGFYFSMEELTDEMNHATIQEFSKLEKTITPPITPPEFTYKPITRRIHITLPAGMRIEFPPLLETILGLSYSQNPICHNFISKEKKTIRGDLSCDLQTGIHALYVYCDLLQFTHVGDIKAPLLRVVDSGGEAGDVVTRYYEKPRYIPLQKKTFDTIEIVIRDDLGERILFENGKVLLTLHFRRARNQYLI